MTYREAGCRPLRYRRGRRGFWRDYLALRFCAYQHAMSTRTL